MIKRLVTMVTSACLTMAGLVTVTTLAVPAAASAATTRSASQAASILAGQIRPTAESTGGTDVAPAVSCYGGAVNVAFVDTGEFGPYTTTSRCRDINMRTTNGTNTYVCV